MTTKDSGNGRYSKVRTTALLGGIAAMALYFANTGLRTVIVLERIEMRMGIQETQSAAEHSAMADTLRRIENQQDKKVR